MIRRAIAIFALLAIVQAVAAEKKNITSLWDETEVSHGESRPNEPAILHIGWHWPTSSALQTNPPSIHFANLNPPVLLLLYQWNAVFDKFMKDLNENLDKLRPDFLKKNTTHIGRRRLNTADVSSADQVQSFFADVSTSMIYIFLYTRLAS